MRKNLTLGLMVICLIITIAIIAGLILKNYWEYALILGIGATAMLMMQLNDMRRKNFFKGGTYEKITIVIAFSFFPAIFTIEILASLLALTGFNTVLFLMITGFTVLIFWDSKNDRKGAGIFRTLNLVFLAIITLTISGFIPLWGSLRVWLPAAFVLVGLATQWKIYSLVSRNKYGRTEIYISTVAAGIAVFVPLVSTVVQFWASDLTKGLLMFAICLTIGISFILWKRRKNEKDAIERKQNSFLTTTRGNDCIDWWDVRNLWDEENVPEEILFKRAELLDEICDTKEQITFTPAIVDFCGNSWYHYYEKTFDDTELGRLKTAIQSTIDELRKYEGWNGYSSMLTTIQGKLNPKMIKNLGIIF